MIIDDLDISILRIFHELKEDEFTGTMLMTEYLFPHESKQKLRAKERTINYRIRRMAPDLITINKRKNPDEKNKNIKYEYIFRSENVKFVDDFQFPNKKSNAIMVKIDGKWCIFEI